MFLLYPLNEPVPSESPFIHLKCNVVWAPVFIKAPQWGCGAPGAAGAGGTSLSSVGEEGKPGAALLRRLTLAYAVRFSGAPSGLRVASTRSDTPGTCRAARRCAAGRGYAAWTIDWSGGCRSGTRRACPACECACGSVSCCGSWIRGGKWRSACDPLRRRKGSKRTCHQRSGCHLEEERKGRSLIPNLWRF